MSDELDIGALEAGLSLIARGIATDEVARGICLSVPALIAAVRERDALRAALEEIRDADQVEMCLDPEWPARVARSALSSLTPPISESGGKEA